MVKQVISLFFFVLIASVLFSCGNSGNTVSVKDIELRQKAKMDSLMQLAKQDSTIRATPKAEENYISTDTTIFNAQQAQIEEQQIDTSFNGEKILYYPGGKKFKQANYTKGILNGECITYYENGTVWAIEHFVNDTFQGQRIIYFENGQTQFVENYASGLLEGKRLEYKSGLKGVWATEYYHNGKLQVETESVSKKYASDGQKCNQCFGHYAGGFCTQCGKASPDRLNESYSKRSSCEYCGGSGYVTNNEMYKSKVKLCPICKGKGVQTY